MGIQILGMVMIIPLIITRFSEEQIAVYYLLVTFIGLQFLLQIGFQPTFVRFISYAFGGLKIEHFGRLGVDSVAPDRQSERVNSESLSVLWAAMWKINLVLGGGAVLVLGLVGTLALLRPVSLVDLPADAWMAWAVIVLVSGLRIALSGFQTYLTGANLIALTQRWQALLNLASVVSMVCVVLIAPSLLLLVVANQAWVLVGVGCYLVLFVRHSSGVFRPLRGDGIPASPVFRLAWASSWRSGVGQACSKATQQSLGIIYAQYGGSALVASYLLGMRFIEVVERFAMAPFYTKIPLLNRLRSRGDLASLREVAVRGVFRANIVYVCGFGVLAVAGPAVFDAVGGNVPFPSPVLWYLLGVAFFLQRFGANHIHLYSTTNHIIWHWASGLQGAAILLSSVVLAPIYGDVGFAAALLVGNFVYAVFTAFYSYRVLPLSPLRFELKTLAPAILGLGILALCEYIFSLSSIIAAWATGGLLPADCGCCFN